MSIIQGDALRPPLRPPFSYYGGKTKLAHRIVPLLPEHEHYVEPFAGSLSVLLAKPVSRMETVNDIDQRLMTFWRVLRDRPDDLVRVCMLTPNSRAEYKASNDAVPDDLESARRTWVMLSQGRKGGTQDKGWRYVLEPVIQGQMHSRLTGYINRMNSLALRLALVTLECLDALDIITRYGTCPSTLLYVDPPYLNSSRVGAGYAHEMGKAEEHEALANVLSKVDAAVVLSGYPSTLYNDLYDGWYQTDLSTRASVGRGIPSSLRTEVLWSNRPFVESDALW
jgi:DNA adenine methylase